MKTLTMDVLQEDIKSLNSKIDRLKASLQEAERERDATLLVIAKYSEMPKKRVLRNAYLGINSDSLKGMTLEVALIHIAKCNNGIVRSSPARELLKEAGILNGAQNGHKLWNTLQLSEHFEKVAYGTYRLIDGQTENLPNGESLL